MLLVKIRDFETSGEKIEYLAIRRSQTENEIEIRALGHDSVLIIIDEIPLEKFQQVIVQALSSVELAEMLILKMKQGESLGDDTK